VLGGAGVAYYHASVAGDVTLLNIQNADITPLMIHIVLYDPDSIDILSFRVPVSAYDNWGCSITTDGTSMVVTPQTPCFYPAPNNGCFGSLTSLPNPPGADGLSRGYIGITIAAGDSVWYGGDGNGDPRNDPLTTGTWFRFLDVIEARTAYLGPANAWAFAMNAWMLQGFVNIATLNEATAGIGGGWDSIADAGVPFHYNCDGDTADAWVGTDDGNGPKIDSWEILLTDWVNWALIADDTNAGGNGDTYYTAYGSTSVGPSTTSIALPVQGAYWGRYNENPAVGSDSVLITIFPANNGPGNVPACNLDSRVIAGIICDDNEFCPDFTIVPDEVNAITFGPGGIPIPGTAGDFRIQAAAPLSGIVFTYAGSFADVYPLITEGKFINVADGFNNVLWGTGHALDGAVTEVEEISFQESHP
jgi:hypothetical protein